MGGREKKKYKRVQGLVKRTVSKSGSPASSALKLQRKGKKKKKKEFFFFKTVKLMYKMYTVHTAFSISMAFTQQYYCQIAIK